MLLLLHSRAISPGSQTQPGQPHSHQPPTWLCPAKQGIDRAKITAKTITSLFIGFSLQPEYYHQSAGRFETIQSVGRELIRRAEYAYAFRQIEEVQSSAQLLLSLPQKQYQQIGAYYLGWHQYRSEDGNPEKARCLLEQVAEEGPASYRARALFSLAALEARKGDSPSELYFLLEGLKASRHITTTVEGLRGIAIIKAKEGDSRKALTDLENIMPLAKASDPLVFYSYLNSLATELSIAGRVNEALNISKTVLASPLASPLALAYPEWQDTANEIKQLARPATKPQIVAPEILPSNVIPFPDNSESATVQAQAGECVDFEEEKKRKQARMARDLVEFGLLNSDNPAAYPLIERWHKEMREQRRKNPLLQASMTQRVATSNLAFIIQTSISKFAALKDRAELVRELVSLGESAFALRQWDKLKDVGDTLAGLSLPDPLQAIGHYYYGLAVNPFSRGDGVLARNMFEQAVENAPLPYKARALVSLAPLAEDVGDRERQLAYYVEAAQLSSRPDVEDFYTAIQAHRGIAIFYSLEGDHRRALDELESLWPIVRATASSDPVTYLRWLNSLAVELGELGQIEHACEAARIVMASPLASAYPEWQETAADLAAMQTQAIIIQVPAVAALTVSKVSTTPGPSLLIYWLWSLARPIRLAPPASARNTLPNPSNSILARYVTQARIRAPDFLSS